MSSKQYGRKNNLLKAYAEGDYFFLPTYAKREAMRVLPAEFARFMVGTGPVGNASYRANGIKFGYITSYLLKASAAELLGAAKAAGKILEIRDVREDTITVGDKEVVPAGESLEFFPGTQGSKNGAAGVKVNRVFVLDSDFDDEYSLNVRHTDLGALTEGYFRSLRHDVAIHCADVNVKEKGKAVYSVVERVDPIIRFLLTKAYPRLVIKDGKGATHDICPIDIGINTSEGCLANLLPNGFYDPEKNCTYCYAYQNGLPFLTTLYDVDRRAFEELMKLRKKELPDIMRKLKARKPVYVRLGQNVEVNHPRVIRSIPGYRDAIVDVWEYFASEIRGGREFRLSMPTKTPEYDSARAKLKKAANVSELISVGDDSMEPGILSHGFPTLHRLEEGLRDAEAGVPVTIYIAVNIVAGRRLLLPSAKTALEFYEKHANSKNKLQLAYLDFRVTNKKDAKLITGKPWEEVKRPKDMFGPAGGWKLTNQGYLAAVSTHPDYLKKSIKLCSTHVDECEQRCFECNMRKSPYLGIGAGKPAGKK